MPEPEDKYGRFFREHNIDIEAIEEAALNGGGVTDHGALTGLNDDDHLQYHTDARGDARYYTKVQTDSLFSGLDNVVFPIEELGLVAANGNPESFRDPSSTGSNGWFVAIYVPAGRPITGCLTAVHTAGTIGAGGENGFAIYNSTGTQIGLTTSDNDLFGSTGIRSKNLDSSIAAATSGRIVYVEMRREGWSVEPFFAFLQTANNAGMFDDGWPTGIRRSFIAGGTGHPASINPTTHGSTANGYMPFIGLY